MENFQYASMFLVFICGSGFVIAGITLYAISKFGKNISEAEAQKLVAQIEKTKTTVSNDSTTEVKMMTLSHLGKYIEELEKAQQEHEKIAKEIRSLQQVNNAIYKGV